jgi:hypothetical protein
MNAGLVLQVQFVFKNHWQLQVGFVASITHSEPEVCDLNIASIFMGPVTGVCVNCVAF